MNKNNLKKIRMEQQLTIRELSEISGVSMGYICHLELGTRNNPSKAVMQKIAEALGKNVIEIFFK